jgi:ribose/xylose/arabinose/galactoside ABC-type transport system permease subunit
VQVRHGGLILTGVSAYWLQAVEGPVIVVAVLFNQWRQSRRQRGDAETRKY